VSPGRKLAIQVRNSTGGNTRLIRSASVRLGEKKSAPPGSSRFVSASRFAEAVRGHWGVESMHWQLDVTFGEDQSRTRLGHADANFSVLRRAALALLKNETTAKVGMKNRRLRAGWDETYLEKVLFGQ
jgi:hypothetical protein